MAGGGSSKSTNAARTRKRVEAETAMLKRAKDGSAFTRCDECNKDVPVVLINMHSCSLDSKIKMNLEATVVEKPAERKKTATSEKKGKNGKKVKDPNAPKRPPTAFFLFMTDFRKEYKEEHPDNKSVAVVAKEGGEKWKALTDEEKKVYTDKAAELKAEYAEVMEKYNAENEETNETEENAENDETNETEENVETEENAENEEVVEGDENEEE